MNKLFTITLCALSLLFSQVTLSEPIITRTLVEEVHTYTRTHTLRLHEEFLKNAILQITPENTIIVKSSADCDTILVVLYEGKLKVYSIHPPVEELQEIQEGFNDMYECDDVPFYSDSNNPIFHTPKVKLKEIYYSNKKQCFINAAKSIDLVGCLIESPSVVLKTKELEIISCLIDTHTVELQSNNEESLLSSIKFTLKDGTNFEFQPLLMGTVDFEYNFAAISCSYVSKVEIECLPGSFYLENNAICFN